MLTIVIQAGGRSSRMGQDKALMKFLGRPLIERQVERFTGLADELMITTNHPEPYAYLGVPLIPDVFPGAGALGGLYTALFAASQPYVAVVACDMPFILPALLLAQRDLLIREEVDAVIPHSPDGPEPLHAVYRRSACLPAVEDALQAGERRMVSWYGSVRVRAMTPDEVAVYDPNFYSFINANSPAEFTQAEELARQLAAQGAYKL